MWAVLWRYKSSGIWYSVDWWRVGEALYLHQRCRQSYPCSGWVSLWRNALSVSTSALEGCELSHSKPFASSGRKDFCYPLSMRLGGGGRHTRAGLNDREKEKNISCRSLELIYRSSSTLPTHCTELRNPDPYVRPCQWLYVKRKAASKTWFLVLLIISIVIDNYCWTGGKLSVAGL